MFPAQYLVRYFPSWDDVSYCLRQYQCRYCMKLRFWFVTEAFSSDVIFLFSKNIWSYVFQQKISGQIFSRRKYLVIFKKFYQLGRTKIWPDISKTRSLGASVKRQKGIINVLKYSKMCDKNKTVLVSDTICKTRTIWSGKLLGLPASEFTASNRTCLAYRIRHSDSFLNIYIFFGYNQITK